MKSLVDKSYANYLRLNNGQVSRLSYLNMSKECDQIHKDFMCAFVSLFSPEIINLNGGYFIEVAYTRARHEKMLEDGADSLEIPYWMNIIELTSLLGDVDFDYAVEIGTVMRDCWNARLNKKFPDSGFSAQLVLWEDLDEVWVTLCKLPTE